VGELGVDEELVGLLGEAARILGDRDPVLRSQLLSRQAAQVMFFDSTRFGVLADEAVAAARVADDPGSLALALTMQTWGERLLAGAPDLRDRYEEIAALARAANNSDLVLSSTWNLLVNGMYSGDPSAVATHLDQISKLASESRSPTHLVNAMTARGAVAALRGDYAETDRLAGEILSQGHRMGDESLVQIVGVLLFPAFRERGRLAEFESATRRVVQEAPTVAAWRAGLATILIESGRHDEARRVVADLAADDFAAVNQDVTLTFTLASIGEAAAVLGDFDGVVAGAYDRLLPGRWSHVILGNSAYHGSVERYLGLLAMARGDAALAIEHLDAAVAAHEAMQARPWTARTRYDLARAHLLRDGPGDRERAVTLLNRALDTANEIGMPRLVEQALEVKLGLQGVASSSSPELSIDVVAAAVSMERPSLGGSPDGRVTIMFSDIEGYTELTERLGDARTQEVLHSHNDIITREVRTRGGSVVKSQGDGFMLAFAGVREALRCAIAIERAVAACDFGSDAGTLRVRIGVHVGDAIREGDDFYGRTVIVASRVAAMATGGEILVTEEVRDLAGSDMRFGAGRELALKGLRRPQRVFALE
jgi:class 3 adenylate cyclase